MADRIKGLIAVLAPDAVCDPCLADRLGLASAHQASHRTRAQAGEQGFERRKDRCALCGETRVVTRKNPH